METLSIGFLSGVISVIAIYIFIQSIRRGKDDTPGTLKKRIDRNNSDIRQSNEQLRKNNTEAGEVTAAGLGDIKDTRKSVSDIIKAAKRKGHSDD